VIEDQELLAYFRRGYIPGPDETEEAFLGRIQNPLPIPEWNEIGAVTQPLFGFAIDWVPLTYSNQKIAWWEGAATWISDTSLSIQLRSAFQKGTFLGYKRIEVLAHEAVHAARARFDQPQFEEILAYATSTKRWRRFLGPLFTYSWEPLIVLMGLLSTFFWLPLCGILFIPWLGWLTYRQFIFKKCCRKLSLSIAVCLTDREIKKLAFAKPSEIEAFFQNTSTPRFRVLKLVFDERSKGFLKYADI